MTEKEKTITKFVITDNQIICLMAAIIAAGDNCREDVKQYAIKARELFRKC